MKNDSLQYIMRSLRIVCTAFLAIFVVRTYLIEPGRVNNRSMEPTLYDEDVIAVEKFSGLFVPFRRGEIVQFVDPTDSKLYIKRVAGLPGEQLVIHEGVVSITDASGRSVVLPEPFLSPRPADSNPRYDPEIRLVVPAYSYFLLGDNRARSSDSRVFGPVHRSSITGRVIKLFDR